MNAEINKYYEPKLNIFNGYVFFLSDLYSQLPGDTQRRS
jgi:hypothetical protein